MHLGSGGSRLRVSLILNVKEEHGDLCAFAVLS
jgi:hypothetical protein